PADSRRTGDRAEGLLHPGRAASSHALLITGTCPTSHAAAPYLCTTPSCGLACRVARCRGGAGRSDSRAEVLGRQEQGRRGAHRGEAQVPAAAVQGGTPVDPPCLPTAQTQV